MDMWVVQQILSPCVEHAQETDRGTEMRGVRRDLEERSRTRLEEQIVDDPFILQGQPRKLVREREDDVVVPDREEFVLSGGEPLIARVRQTLRAVPISTANGELSISCLMESPRFWGVSRKAGAHTGVCTPDRLPITEGS
jgi:hypothetical protein